MYYVYILKSHKDDTHYVGYTHDIGKRLKEHNSGKSRYTSGHAPYDVVYFEFFSTLKEAKSREIHFKRMKNIRVFLKMVKGSPDKS
ncbi:MAG: GIY-YIG nuclease family protein [Candidatus Roizmanbacteria bacterium]